MTSPSYPASLDALANPGPTTETDDTGYELDIVVARLQNCIMAIETKLGIGASTPVAGVLRRTSGTTTNWGAIQQLDIGAGQISQMWSASSLPSSSAGQATANLWADQPGSSLTLTGVTVGSVVIALVIWQARHTAAGGRCQVRLVRTDTGAALTWASVPIGHASANGDLQHTLVGAFTAPVTPLTVSVQTEMLDAGTMTTFATTSALYVLELRR